MRFHLLVEVKISPVDCLQQTHSTLLHLAAVSDYVGQLSSLALVKELVKRKADLDIENDEGFRPLHLACGLRDMDARNLNTQVTSHTTIFLFVMQLRAKFCACCMQL